MTDKRALIDKIKRKRGEHQNYIGYEWELISELESAWQRVSELEAEVKKSDCAFTCQREIAIQHSFYAEAAEKDAAYQRRHRKWALKRMRDVLGAYMLVRDCSDGRWARLESVRADLDDLANDYDDLRADRDRLLDVLEKYNPNDPTYLEISAALEEKP